MLANIPFARAREQQMKVEVANEEDVGSHCRPLLEVRHG